MRLYSTVLYKNARDLEALKIVYIRNSVNNQYYKALLTIGIQ